MVVRVKRAGSAGSVHTVLPPVLPPRFARTRLIDERASLDVNRVDRDAHRVGLRVYRRKSLGRGFWMGVSKSGVSGGRRGRPASASMSRRGVGGSVQLLKGISYIWRG